MTISLTSLRTAELTSLARIRPGRASISRRGKLFGEIAHTEAASPRAIQSAFHRNRMTTARTLPVAALPAVTALGAAPGSRVRESGRKIPVAHDVDAVVAGGTSGAVAAAEAEDMAATMRLWLEKNEQPSTPLARKVYSGWGADVSRDPVRPMHVKKTLDDALLAAKMPFIFSPYATGVLRDSGGRLAGVTINNRAGRQAILAKAIVDATGRAWVARMAGARFRPYPAGKHKFLRYVVGGKVLPGGRELPLAYLGDGSTRTRAAAAAASMSGSNRRRTAMSLPHLAAAGVSRTVESASTANPIRSRTAEAAWPNSHCLLTSVQFAGSGRLSQRAISVFAAETNTNHTARPAATQMVAATLRRKDRLRFRTITDTAVSEAIAPSSTKAPTHAKYR